MFTPEAEDVLFALKIWDIPTIHNGYCVSNAVAYAKKNDVLPTILSTFSLELSDQ